MIEWSQAMHIGLDGSLLGGLICGILLFLELFSAVCFNHTLSVSFPLRFVRPEPSDQVESLVPARPSHRMRPSPQQLLGTHPGFGLRAR